mmetsp:Transcript_44262/g.138968  ORF Transcript_44262/g.138968 Transcript_44262/m.138968 type:complete len:215 (+) Transcript_44262:5507-6151(+)
MQTVSFPVTSVNLPGSFRSRWPGYELPQLRKNGLYLSFSRTSTTRRLAPKKVAASRARESALTSSEWRRRRGPPLVSIMLGPSATMAASRRMWSCVIATPYCGWNDAAAVLPLSSASWASVIAGHHVDSTSNGRIWKLIWASDSPTSKLALGGPQMSSCMFPRFSERDVSRCRSNASACVAESMSMSRMSCTSALTSTKPSAVPETALRTCFGP